MSQKPTESSSNAFDALRDTIPYALDINVALLDNHGCIVEVNHAWARFAERNGGSQASTGLGINYLDVCRQSASSCHDAKQVLEGILSVAQGSLPRFEHGYRCDSPTQWRWFVTTVVPWPACPGGVVVLHQNFTEVKWAEARYRELLDSVRAIIWRAEAATFKTTFVSGQSEEILGYPPDAWVQDSQLWTRALHPDDKDWVLDYTSAAVRNHQKHSFEYRMIAADGHIVWIRNLVNIIFEEGQPIELIGLWTDITARKQVEHERDLLAQRLLHAQEEERSAFARELHDNISQRLALLKIQLQSINFPQRETGDLIREAEESVETISQEVSDLSHRLHPSLLGYVGLAKALQNHCGEVSKFYNLEISSDIREAPSTLDKMIAITLFRVAQESLRNVVKHSNASRASVSLIAECGEVRLRISDDGIGFDQAAPRRAHGLGLESMSERLRLVGGKLRVISAPGQGTQIEFTVPLKGILSQNHSAPSTN